MEFASGKLSSLLARTPQAKFRLAGDHVWLEIQGTQPKSVADDEVTGVTISSWMRGAQRLRSIEHEDAFRMKSIDATLVDTLEACC